MAIRKTRSDFIREKLVELIPADTEFRTTDAARMVDAELPANFDRGDNFSSLVSSALRTWVDGNRIVNGNRLERISAPAQNAIWAIRALRPQNTKRVSEAVDGTALTVSRITQATKRIQEAAVGEKIELEIVELKANGEALVRREGQLFVLKRFNW